MKFLDFLRDDSPVSTMRIAFIIATCFFIPMFCVIWGILSMRMQALQVIPESVMWFLGTLFAGKVSQKIVEVASGIFSPKKTIPPIEGQQ